MPAEEGIGLDVHQGVTPGEQATQNYHNQPSGIIGVVWLHLPLLKQGKLFAQEEVLGSECAARPGDEDEEVERDRSLWITTSRGFGSTVERLSRA